LCGYDRAINALPAFLKIEIAWAVVFSKFQCTYVTTNAVGLFLDYCLEPPNMPERPRLRFVRVQWTRHAEIESSCVTARQMGFKEEGMMWA
ncbi:hypothetical protein BJV74DRAFT_784767, partial [Russula compacta]